MPSVSSVGISLAPIYWITHSKKNHNEDKKEKTLKIKKIEETCACVLFCLFSRPYHYHFTFSLFLVLLETTNQSSKQDELYDEIKRLKAADDPHNLLKDDLPFKHKS